MSDEIKRCPFCGKSARTNVRVTGMGGDVDRVDFTVECSECGTGKTVRLKIGKTCEFWDVESAMETAIKTWNRRAE